jgi:hypothetical protein
MTCSAYNVDKFGRLRTSITFGETLDYVIDWTDVLTNDADTIQTQSVVVAGISLSGSSFIGLKQIAMLQSNVAPSDNPTTAQYTIVTAGGRTYIKKLYITVDLP